MVLGAWQPYFVPYLGYWQVIAHSDIFIIADDYQFVSNAWINRNRILVNGDAFYFRTELESHRNRKMISEILISPKFDPEVKIKQLQSAYARAPYFKETMELLEPILRYETDRLCDYLVNSIREICKYLEIDTRIELSSSLNQDKELKLQYRLFDFCEKFGADTYVNTYGGMELYDREEFREHGLQLEFLKMNDIQYKQYENEFIPGLSIIDVLMFNSKERVMELLKEYTLL